jgi:hypothetical protein
MSINQRGAGSAENPTGTVKGRLIEMEDKKKIDRPAALHTRRSRILYEITALVVIVLVASGLATFFLVRASQSRLIEKSIDKVIETQSADFSDSSTSRTRRPSSRTS